MRSLATPRTRFGQWAGCPEGVPADPTRCNYEVFPEYLWLHHQCLRKKGHGPGRCTANSTRRGSWDGRSPVSSKRHLRRKSCTGKLAHTRQDALYHAYLLRRKDGGRVVAYKCRFGDHWHVGHAS